MKSCCEDPGGRVGFGTFVIPLRARDVACYQSSSARLLYRAWMKPKARSHGWFPVSRYNSVLYINSFDNVQYRSSLACIGDLPIFYGPTVHDIRLDIDSIDR